MISSFSTSDEVNLLSVLGLTLVVAGAAEQVHISAAVGAFLVGIGISGQAAHQARNFLQPCATCSPPCSSSSSG
ncbi:MAG TPA: cation:proton antiporter [Acidimicrobiia bacterium]|nr:cation:proton antiporter [Acidimicrobiia bacterium]